MFQIDCDWFTMVEKIMKLRLSKCSKLTSKLDYLFIMYACQTVAKFEVNFTSFR